MQVHQLILKGNYRFSNSEAIYRDDVVFALKESITREYIEKIKTDLLDEEKNPLRCWCERDYVSGRFEPIRAFIKTYEVVSEVNV